MQRQSIQGQSRAVTSNQQGTHPRLEEIVARHLHKPYLAPIAQHSQRAFTVLESFLEHPKIILDAGCGTGSSSYRLAQRHADALVIGIDKSADRLTRRSAGYQTRPDNCLLIRADLIDIWRLLTEHGVRLDKHYLLYPNPWPKKKHLQRRWHGSPVFRDLVRLGGKLELRTNWQCYANEFALALGVTGNPATVSSLCCRDQQFVSEFERKYWTSGQRLYRVDADLDQSTLEA